MSARVEVHGSECHGVRTHVPLVMDTYLVSSLASVTDCPNHAQSTKPNILADVLCSVARADIFTRLEALFSSACLYVQCMLDCPVRQNIYWIIFVGSDGGSLSQYSIGYSNLGFQLIQPYL